MEKLILSPPRLVAPCSIIKESLIAEYSCIEVGDILIDGSGNANHGTFAGGTNKPLRTDIGIIFDTDDYITLPDGLKHTMSILKDFTVIVAGKFLTGTILGSTNSTTDRFSLNISSSSLPKTIRGVGYDATKYLGVSAIRDLTSYWAYHTLSYGHLYSTHASKLLVDKSAYRGFSTSSISTSIGCRLGSTPSGINYFSGTLCYVLIYNRLLTDSEILSTNRALKNILKQRGVYVGE